MGTIGTLVYDDDDCELFCWHIAEVLKTCNRIEATMGPDYGAEYRQQLATVICAPLTGPAGGPAPTAWPDPRR